MVGKGNLAVFESSNISKSEKVMLTKIGAHACYINLCYIMLHVHVTSCLMSLYLHEFFEPILID